MDLKLSGKTALISGASKGIGLAIAKGLACEGCNLILTARSEEKLIEEASQISSDSGVEVQIIPADLSTPMGIEAISKSITGLDILVNNAGAIPGGHLHNISMDEWRKAWDLKIYGYISLTQALYDRLQRNSGVVINVIGVAGEYLLPDYVVGSTGNAALMAFTRSLGKQASKTSVRVVGINPGPVATERWCKLLDEISNSNPGKAKHMVESLPLGRPAQPQEIANAVAFLASPLSAYTNATIVTIDGGAVN
jgi:NAD(P)-dependent dehydrogenase (short-subunit alcohol dehydrogenase family)